MRFRNGSSWSGRCEVNLTDKELQMGSYAGVDWAADKHDVLVADEVGEERLLDAGLRVLALHPNQVAATRARFRVSGASRAGTTAGGRDSSQIDDLQRPRWPPRPTAPSVTKGPPWPPSNRSSTRTQGVTKTPASYVRANTNAGLDRGAASHPQIAP